jgi:hypothetical protein
MSQNPNLILKLLLTLNGGKPCVLNCRLFRKMVLGLSHHSRLARYQLVVNECIKLNTVPMVLSSDTKHA